MDELKKILNNYNIQGKIVSIKPLSTGIINNTYVVEYQTDDKKERYLLQEINSNVFKKPSEVMSNIKNVTEFIQKKLAEIGDSKHTTLNIICSKENGTYVKTEDNKYFRLYNFLDNSISYDNTKDINIVYNIGKAFGNFQKLLAEFPIENLYEVIPDFHNTKKRYETFVKDVEKNIANRVNLVQSEIEDLKQREKDCYIIQDLIETGKIPIRVTHNDTKINNVLMDKDTGDFKAVIDLDTVMQGSVLFDYGDGIRSISETCFEDEPNLNKVQINIDIFKSFTDGYLSELAPYLTIDEVNNMGNSIKILTLELCIRFLNDYINGDTYFKIDYPEHNLVRAKNQIKLLKEIENNMDILNEYILDSYQKNLNNK